jgi:hypothetical protein
MSFPVTLSATNPQPITLTYNTIGSTATSGVDFTAPSGTLIIPANTPAGTVTLGITVVGDTNVEPDEVVQINLAGATNATLGTPIVGTGTITNDDFSVITIDSPSITEGNAGTTVMNFTVSLGAPVPAGYTVTVNYGATVNGTATAGSDYVALPAGALTFTAGQQTKTISVTINGDTTYELNETFSITLTSASAGAFTVPITSAIGTGTITNDDTLTASISSPSQAEGNAGTSTLNFTVSLNAQATAITAPVTVIYNGTVDGTATAGSDYVALLAGSTIINAGFTSQTIPVTINGDTTTEPDETFSITLASADLGGVPISLGTATGTGIILNDDVSIVNYTKTAAVGVVTPGVNTQVTYTITINNPFPGTSLTVIDTLDATYTIASATANIGAVSTAGNQVTLGPLTLAAGGETVIITIDGTFPNIGACQPVYNSQVELQVNLLPSVFINNSAPVNIGSAGPCALPLRIPSPFLRAPILPLAPNSSSGAAPEPTPTATDTPTATVRPTSTPTATHSPTSTATPEPTSTVTDLPTSTPTPTVTPTPTKKPKPQPQPTDVPTPTDTPQPSSVPTPKPTSTPVPPTSTPVPPTDVPPTSTPVPPTDVPPTSTPVPPTDVPPTDIPPTDTPVPPTDVPPTDVPPTDIPPTPVDPPRPTDRPVPPTPRPTHEPVEG